MNKTLMIAATLLSLGAGLSLGGGVALAGDGDVYAPPARVSDQTVATPASAHRLFPASNRPQVSVYSMFPAPGNQQEASR